MGCDIHLYTEALKEIGNKEKWISADCWNINPYYDENDEDNHEQYLNVVSIYDHRNYTLFSMLAGVRNYSDNVCIAKARGIPSDVSEPVKCEYEYWGSDGHTHSWLTLEEIKKYVLEHPTTKYSGLVSPSDSIRIDNGEMPRHFCLATSNTTYVYREWEHEHNYFDEIIQGMEAIKKKQFRIWDDEEYPEYDEKVRIVFWFDN